MSTEERTRTDDAGTESRIEPTESYHGDAATRVLEDAATGDLVGRPLHATLLPIGDAARDEPCPYNGTIVGRDDDHRIRLRDGGAVRCAKPEKLDHVELGPQVDRGDGPIPDGGTSPSEEAAEFWDQYDIPIEHDTAIKVRRSGLLRGSSGTGHAKDTVVHLHVLESFRDGRLVRDSGAYLCEKGSLVDFQGREERHHDDGDSYVPAVTCDTCLNRMERWKVAADGGADDE